MGQTSITKFHVRALQVGGSKLGLGAEVVFIYVAIYKVLVHNVVVYSIVHQSYGST